MVIIINSNYASLSITTLQKDHLIHLCPIYKIFKSLIYKISKSHLARTFCLAQH